MNKLTWAILFNTAVYLTVVFVIVKQQMPGYFWLSVLSPLTLQFLGFWSLIHQRATRAELYDAVVVFFVAGGGLLILSYAIIWLMQPQINALAKHVAWYVTEPHERSLLKALWGIIQPLIIPLLFYKAFEPKSKTA